MHKNIYKLFYKDYFHRVDFSYLFESDSTRRKGIEDKNKIVISDMNNEILNSTLFVIPPCKRVNAPMVMKVHYPGLITGVGITHEANIEGEFKLGMHFDYTYGMPVVYGSSVKGVLRSVFRDEVYIQSLINRISKKNIDVKELFEDIFEGNERDPEHDDVVEHIKAYKSKSIYKRDLFFDAVIIKPDSNGHILETDYITPHKNPLKNPVPISFVKIASGCNIEFRFRLVDSILTRQEKYSLFLLILQEFGVGAKTNVGYGNMQMIYS